MYNLNNLFNPNPEIAAQLEVEQVKLKNDDVPPEIQNVNDTMATLRKVRGDAFVDTVEMAMLALKNMKLVALLLDPLLQSGLMDRRSAEGAKSAASSVGAMQIRMMSVRCGLDSIKDAEEVTETAKRMVRMEEDAVITIMRKAGAL